MFYPLCKHVNGFSCDKETTPLCQLPTICCTTQVHTPLARGVWTTGVLVSRPPEVSRMTSVNQAKSRANFAPSPHPTSPTFWLANIFSYEKCIRMQSFASTISKNRGCTPRPSLREAVALPHPATSWPFHKRLWCWDPNADP